MEDLRFTILIPTYNGAGVVGETLQSILSQTYSNFEIVIQDDASRDGIERVVEAFHSEKIKFYKNKTNLGYSKNLESMRAIARGDIVYLMGQDDILRRDALLNTYSAFKLSNEIGAVTRPYYWFDKNIEKPVRMKAQLNPERDEVVRITDDPRRVIRVFQTLDQLSALAYRREYMDTPFHEDIFPCHIYPFVAIFKKYPVVFLKDYNLAVRINSSQTRSLSSIYAKSPMQSWVEMFRVIFSGPEYRAIQKKCIKDFVAVNYVGLVQIKNYARFHYLVREIWYLIRYRWQNVYNPVFWFFSIGCLVVPRSLLRFLVDWYKENINSILVKFGRPNFQRAVVKNEFQI